MPHQRSTRRAAAGKRQGASCAGLRCSAWSHSVAWSAADLPTRASLSGADAPMCCAQPALACASSSLRLSRWGYNGVGSRAVATVLLFGRPTGHHQVEHRHRSAARAVLASRCRCWPTGPLTWPPVDPLAWAAGAEPRHWPRHPRPAVHPVVFDGMPSCATAAAQASPWRPAGRSTPSWAVRRRRAVLRPDRRFALALLSRLRSCRRVAVLTVFATG